MTPHTAPHLPPDWEPIARAIRGFFIRHSGCIPFAVNVEMLNGPDARMPIPQVPHLGGEMSAPSQRPATEAPTQAPQQRPPAAPNPAPQRPARRPTHSPDFRLVVWNDRRYPFSEVQARIVRVLWEAWEGDEQLDVAQDVLLREAGSVASRLVDLFRRHGAWNDLIVSDRPGHYRLCFPPPDTWEEDEG